MDTLVACFFFVFFSGHWWHGIAESLLEIPKTSWCLEGSREKRSYPPGVDQHILVESRQVTNQHEL